MLLVIFCSSYQHHYVTHYILFCENNFSKGISVGRNDFSWVHYPVRVQGFFQFCHELHLLCSKLFGEKMNFSAAYSVLPSTSSTNRNGSSEGKHNQL